MDPRRSAMAPAPDLPCRSERRTLSHSMFVSFVSEWIGQTQRQVVRIEGDIPRLRTASPIQSWWENRHVPAQLETGFEDWTAGQDLNDMNRSGR
jgi:hypothetical protein